MSHEALEKVRRLLIWLFLAVLLAAGLALWRPWHKPEREVIRVAYLPIYVDLPLFVAVQERLFETHSVTVELQRFQSSPDIGAALVSDTVDAAASVATSSALALQTRDPGRFKIFLVDAETPANYLSSLLVASSSSIRSITDLRGSTIASFPGPTAKLFGPLALAKLGLAPKDYTVVELEIGSHISALETGRVDAVITYEPTATQAVLKYGSRKLIPGLIESEVINPWQAGIWVVRSSFLRDHPREARNFVLAIYDAVELIRRNPAKAKESLLPYTTIDLAVAQQTPDIPFTKVGEIDMVTLQKHADLLTEKGMLSKAVEIPQLIMDMSPDGSDQ
jgi:NitT/TauT family transport system substrate-binding protein